MSPTANPPPSKPLIPEVLPPASPPQHSLGRRIALFFVLGFGVLYILNPTAGLFELLPDLLPGVGNLDEAGATALVIWAGRELFFRDRSRR